MKLSLCMVVRNAEPQLKRIHKATKTYVDEYVIFDQDSTDGTPDFCKEIGASYVKTTRKDLADIDRQDCYAMATGDFVLALDWDELPDKRLVAYIQEMKLKGMKYDVIFIPFNNTVRHGSKKVNISSILGDDWHPRIWRNDQSREPVIVWPNRAHTFPEIRSPNFIFTSRGKINHERTLKQIRATSEQRRQVIDPENQQRELMFINAVEQKLGVKSA